MINLRKIEVYIFLQSHFIYSMIIKKNINKKGVFSQSPLFKFSIGISFF